jgi:hypothetical protein
MYLLHVGLKLERNRQGNEIVRRLSRLEPYMSEIISVPVLGERGDIDVDMRKYYIFVLCAQCSDIHVQQLDVGPTCGIIQELHRLRYAISLGS